MKKVLCAGGIVCKNSKILLIRHIGGGLAFPKGHVEPGETTEQTAVREVEEETGVRASIVSYLGSVERLSTERSGEKVIKTIEIYLMRQTDLAASDTDEIPVWTKTKTPLNEIQFPEEAYFLESQANQLQI